MSSSIIPFGLDRVCGFFHVSNRLLPHSGMSSSVVTFGLDCGSGFFMVFNRLLWHSGISIPVIPGLDPGSPFSGCLRIPLNPDYHVI
jgi:hypothetical protein